MTSPLNNLALLRPGIRTRRVSSYDRTGGSNDFVRVDAGEKKTLADIGGADVVKHLAYQPYCRQLKELGGDIMRQVIALFVSLSFLLFPAALRPVAAQTPLGLGVLHSLGGADAGGNPDGSVPFSGLTAGGDGYLYGVGFSGGAGGSGTIFKVRPDGSGYQTLHSFSPASGFAPYGNTDGINPYGTLLPGGDGFFYGTAERGGANNSGTLFKIRADGSGFTAVHSFSASDSAGHNADGREPFNGLVSGGDGFFYGVTLYGGVNNSGAVFQVNSDGSVFNTLHSFGPASEGNGPNGGLAALGGVLYGMAEYGGSNATGTIFRLRTDGTGFLVLHSFSANLNGNSDGANPSAGLTPGPGGLLYGITAYGGANNSGAVFSLQTNGSGFTVLHTFSATDSSGYNADGKISLYANLALGPDGLLYGSAADGGAGGYGTIFRLAPDGSAFQTLHSFSGAQDGSSPSGTLIFDPNGFVYGLTTNGGLHGAGVLFRLAPVHTHLLWDTADGRASLWTIDALGHVTYSPTYGPYDSGRWKAAAAAAGPDGRSHLLWTHPSDGTYSVWDITDPNHPTVLPTYGPYPGWSALALTVGSDGVDRLLWNDSQTFTFGGSGPGPASLWSLNSAGGFGYQLYGPYSTWSTAALASSEGGISHLLWHNTGGQASLWTVGPAGDFQYSPTYGPFSGWQTTGLAVGLQGERELLWTHGSDGAASLWRVNAGGTPAVFPPTGAYGPYSGYSCVAVTADPAGTTYLLWSHPADGKAAFWALDGAGDIPGTGTSTQSGYGPFPDGHGGFWAPVAASAGP